jgi:hypothetical protein
LGTAATTGLLYQPRMIGDGDCGEIWWNDDWQGKPKYSEKTCPNATLSTTNRTRLDPGLNPGRRVGKPATNRLSYGAAYTKCYTPYNFTGFLSCDVIWKQLPFVPVPAAARSAFHSSVSRGSVMRHNLLPLFLNDVKLNCSILRLKYVHVPLGENARATVSAPGNLPSGGLLLSCSPPPRLFTRVMIYFWSRFVNCTMISYRMFTQ